MTRPPLGYADAEAIAVGYGWAIGSVYRWASLDHWHRIRYRGHVLYALADVDVTRARITAVAA